METTSFIGAVMNRKRVQNRKAELETKVLTNLLQSRLRKCSTKKQARYIENIFVKIFYLKGSKVSTKWTSLERIVLVGCVYDQLFLNPMLRKKSWKNILTQFENYFKKFEKTIFYVKSRSISAIKRYFKELKRENSSKDNLLLKTLHAQWRFIKTLS
eukprot:snap_masked-scaffold_9-processed-gene-12.36-mRNA-1 protein AED:1.00 eAED:1.00 QI:0/-1/0/0/-1/1/1/0/156